MPPELLEFTAAQIQFDAGPGAVTVDLCATASDHLSALAHMSINVRVILSDVGPILRAGSSDSAGTGPSLICAQPIAPQLVRCVFYGFQVFLTDAVGNQSEFRNSVMVFAVRDRPTIRDCEGTGATGDSVA